jgi:hypothetical protein
MNGKVLMPPFRLLKSGSVIICPCSDGQSIYLLLLGERGRGRERLALKMKVTASSSYFGKKIRGTWKMMMVGQVQIDSPFHF